MSLDRAIRAGKEHRGPYYRGGRFDRTCRPGGSCPYCRSNRTIQAQRTRAAAMMRLAEWPDDLMAALVEQDEREYGRDDR